MAAAVLAVSLLAPVTMPITPPPVTVSIHDAGQTGERSSAYLGKFYDPNQEQYRKCVSGREGRNNYAGTGNWGFYQGTYQLNNDLVSGVGWMMSREIRENYPNWRIIRGQLLDAPGHKWGRFWQDMAFYTILNWRGKGVGATHWAGGRYGCQL